MLQKLREREAQNELSVKQRLKAIHGYVDDVDFPEYCYNEALEIYKELLDFLPKLEPSSHLVERIKALATKFELTTIN